MGENAAMIRIKRVYDPPEPTTAPLPGGATVAAGIKKAELHGRMAEGGRPQQPVAAVVRHDPARWPQFRRRYFAELARHPRRANRSARRSRGNVTLLYSARDEEHNNA